ncbi:DUF927 domain-containing protein [Suttonella sp. R2A3]|uniref:DUF927 domain-containing protein n=1 Tax=Suttonella sp. R2A3 TaxID=2908648 RepID=UPI001F23974E|nr:DUF927 domain-containing protein [Suttonella sp. R2A3]UJF24773.1 DUF927 domain-containing protein [Suttonella sp. R2A3]
MSEIEALEKLGINLTEVTNQQFTVTDEGIFHNGSSSEKICDYFTVEGDAIDDNGVRYYILKADNKLFALAWADLGDNQGWKVMRGVIRGIPPDTRRKNKLVEFIQTRDILKRWALTDTAGWHGDAYILPSGEIIGEADGVLFQRPQKISAYGVAGTLEDWQQHLGRYIVGNSRFCLMMGAAFAAPMIEWFGIEGGILHLYGSSSGGKTTAQRLAQSVWGHGIHSCETWNGTGYALTNTAAARNNGLLSLDEIGQDERGNAATQCTYSISNGKGKIQGAKDGGNRPELRFCVLGVSSGEITLDEHLARHGKQAMAGQLVRCPSISHELEAAHGFESMKAFTDHINDAVTRYYGEAGRVFIAEIVKDKAAAKERAKELYQRFLDELISNHAMGKQQSRAARLFAAAYVGLIMAKQYGIIGIDESDAREGVNACLIDWLEKQPQGLYEDERIKENAIDTMPTLQPQFVSIIAEGTNHVFSGDYVGFVADDGEGKIYDVLPAMFKKYFALGDNAAAMNRATQVLGNDMGWLNKPKGKGWQHVRRFNGESIKVYRFRGIAPPE